MATQITMTFKPEGFAECLRGMENMVRSECEKLAEQAGGLDHYTITVANEPRFQDARYGASRPVVRAVPVGRITADSQTSADEAENKTMSKAVTG